MASTGPSGIDFRSKIRWSVFCGYVQLPFRRHDQPSPSAVTIFIIGDVLHPAVREVGKRALVRLSALFIPFTERTTISSTEGRTPKVHRLFFLPHLCSAGPVPAFSRLSRKPRRKRFFSYSSGKIIFLWKILQTPRGGPLARMDVATIRRIERFLTALQVPPQNIRRAT